MVDKATILANAKIVVRELMSEPDPLPLISAAAVGGNAWRENLMQPITRGPKDHGSDGLMQWRLSRLTELQRRKDWDTLPVQVQFFKDECKRDYPALWRMLVNPGNRTIENLTANICDIYERPSKAGRVLDQRIKYAKQVYALFDTTPPKSNPPPVVVQNAKEPVSTGFGLLGALVAWLVSTGKLPAETFGIGWAPYALFAVVAIFFFRLRRNEPQTESENDMTFDPAAIMKLVQVIELIVEEIPKIKAEIDAIKGALAAQPEQSDPNILANLEGMISKLGGQQ